MLIDWGRGLSLSVQEMEFRQGKAVYLTILPAKPILTDSAVRFLFLNLYQYLRKNQIQILLEKNYGLPSLRGRITSIRNRAIQHLGGNAAVPLTYIGCTPCVGGKMAGVHLIGFVGADESVRVDTILMGSKPVGRMLETNSFRGIYLSGLSGARTTGQARHPSIAKQCESIVKQCRDIFERYDFKAQNIVRTWIYFPRLLHWYKRFLKIRAKYFREFGIISDKNHYLPASTGIQGGGAPHEEIFIDLIGFLPKKKRVGFISTMRSQRQDEATKYGATFSRGVAIDIDRATLMHISGTASINPKGETIYLRDEQGQITETLINIGALLESKKARLENLVLSTAYCKDKRTYETFRDVVKYLHLSSIPFILVYADVCRDNLLFEIDGIAVK